MLYLVSTPIGNLQDITLRALKTLFSVDLILCEDTRKTLNLLNHYSKQKQSIPPLLSFYEENELKRLPKAIERLKRGENLALVTNSGTPTISDPGFKLVRECWKKGVRVVPVPGPSSVTASLSISGLPTDKFLFMGFLPSKSSRRIKIFQQILKIKNIFSLTVIFFDSPYRIKKSLEDLQKIFGDIQVVLCREITKTFEEILNEKISQLIKKYSQNPIRGEIVILFNLSSPNSQQ